MTKTESISKEQEQVLLDAWDYCDDNDKSTEFMIQYMSDVANVEYSSVVDFVAGYSKEEEQ